MWPPARAIAARGDAHDRIFGGLLDYHWGLYISLDVTDIADCARRRVGQLSAYVRAPANQGVSRCTRLADFGSRVGRGRVRRGRCYGPRRRPRGPGSGCGGCRIEVRGLDWVAGLDTLQGRMFSDSAALGGPWILRRRCGRWWTPAATGFPRARSRIASIAAPCRLIRPGTGTIVLDGQPSDTVVIVYRCSRTARRYLSPHAQESGYAP